jgi:spermidine synthase
VLLGSVFVVAACGLVYELVAGAVSSYLLGDAVTQFSLVIGVFMSAMGLGSWLSRYVTRDLLRTFVDIEIALGLVGGTASIGMFAASAFLAPWFPVVFYALCGVIGALVGLEIPLLVRIIREQGAGLSTAVSDVLALDYVGALVGAVAFPFLALPALGLSRSSVAFGLLNLAVAAVGVRLLPERRGPSVRLGLAAVALLGVLAASGRLVGWLEDVLYQDAVIYAESSRYQRIVLTRWRDDVRLYLDGNVQFSSVDEARYHEALVVPIMQATRARRVLVLGGGDGLAVREILRYPEVERVDLVDLDASVVRLGRARPELLALNGGSLGDRRVSVHIGDAMRFVAEATDRWDAVIVDLPDPNDEALSKLYSTGFYAMVTRRLTARGMLVTQATSPYFAPDAFWCIVGTLRAAVDEPPLQVLPYHTWVPSFGDWGFVLAGRTLPEVAELEPSVPTRYLDREVLQGMFVFAGDEQPPEDTLRVNRMDDPVLYTYYKRGWKRFNQ